MGDNLDVLPPGLKTASTKDESDLPESPSTEFPEPPDEFPRSSRDRMVRNSL